MVGLHEKVLYLDVTLQMDGRGDTGSCCSCSRHAILLSPKSCSGQPGRRFKGPKELIHRSLPSWRISREEKLVLAVFSVTCFFWIFRQNLNSL